MVDAFFIPVEKRVAIVHIKCIEHGTECQDTRASVPLRQSNGHALCWIHASTHFPVYCTVAAGRRLVGHFKKSTKAITTLKEKKNRPDPGTQTKS